MKVNKTTIFTGFLRPNIRKRQTDALKNGKFTCIMNSSSDTIFNLNAKYQSYKVFFSPIFVLLLKAYFNRIEKSPGTFSHFLWSLIDDFRLNFGIDIKQISTFYAARESRK